MSQDQPISEEDLSLLILADSNLPVGGFVSSSGLESFVNHAYFNQCHSDLDKSQVLLDFLFSNSHNYASICAPFFYHLNSLVANSFRSQSDLLALKQLPHREKRDESSSGSFCDGIVSIIHRLNGLYDAMCLSHVNRRNSYAQGAAFLMLYAKSFSPPSDTSQSVDGLKRNIIEAVKSQSRTQKWPIHFPISFALVTAILGLSFDRAIHLHLFLHIRSILSSAVRLNIIGPYLSQRLLFTNAKGILDQIILELKDTRLSRADQIECGLTPEDDAHDETEGGPASTCPFWEIIQTRHDVCRVRLFNS
ncbi:hypothetical protein O181_073076 [Austropuccinia psidii MF-1]|uniref:Uncharacterized protein n=1 Tax=Austropuccinia psidii MF-1 TaxID=1389203 RepID=A0A9Q3FAF0_9BASI|nr:hypothetical protein [Austropuccinia psidii MF-1]